MISKHTYCVIKREIRTTLGKSFVVATIFIPLLMFAIVGIQLG